MIEISLNKINKNYGFNDVLKDLSFEIKTNEKVALIGSNGCGKTTTLRLIMGKEIPDSGNIYIRKDHSIGYLTQIPSLEKDNITAKEVYLRGIKYLKELEEKINVFVENMKTDEKSLKQLSIMQEEFRIKGGYELNTKIERIRHGFKLDDSILNTAYNNLSGGEKTIINLAALMLSNPEILLLDEPTNHLDINMLEWFEEYLKEYKGTVIIVSHDRYFLDKVIDKVICIEKGNSDIYHGNYSYYLEESEKRLMIEFQKYKNQQKEIKAIQEAIIKLKEWGKKGDNPIFFRRAASMQKRLDKMEVLDKPKTKNELKINLLVNNRSANNVLTINNLNLSIEDKELLKDSSMNIYYQDRVCLMGKNGSGKTTLIKNIINNTHEKIKLGTNIKIGYIPQEIRFDNEELTIYEHMRKIFIGSESELRSKLHRFYFGDISITKKLKNISGGEKVRIKLLELILSKSNFLILDEPTNHIDIDTKEILENSLNEFEGTILFISHDRYFINKVCNRIVRIEDKKLVSYNGNYDSIKDKQIINNKKEPIKQVINIKGSNRLNEFLKETTSIEEVYTKKDKKIYKIRKKSKIFYLTIADHLSKESISLDYLKEKISIPEKIFYEKYNSKSYILTKSLKGKSLEEFLNPMEVIDILIETYNKLYNIDYSDCVIDETIDIKIKRIEEKLKQIESKDIDFKLIEKFHTKDNIIKYLKGNKPKQIIGFTHGNMKLSNIYADNNHFSGITDVKDCGLSDIYYDLVTTEISIEEKYGKEYIDIFYDKLGIEKDEFKSEYYRIIINLLA